MSNNIKHTAAYQVSFFLNSEISQNFDLDFKDIAILRTVADFMDMNNEQICFAKQEKLSKISRVPRRTLIKHLTKLVELKIINKDRKRYLNHYSLGSVIISHVQQWHISSATVAHLKCSSGTLYNKSNNRNNNRDCAEKEHQLAPTAKDPSPLVMKYSSLLNKDKLN